MSDPTVISMGVTVFVGALAIAGGIINERYKRHRDRVAVAAVLHADISALRAITLATGNVQNFEALANLLEQGQDIPFPQVLIPEMSQGPIFHAYIDKIGLLRAADAQDVILFYEYLVGIRFTLKNLVAGAWDGQPQSVAIKAAQIRNGLRFWSQCADIADRLLPALQRTARQQFTALPGPDMRDNESAVSEITGDASTSAARDQGVR
jgi:hypothetical protein